ncbi:MAG TPA: tyrosine--tRNA ligase [Candidatus Saccharimonadales bacterium]|nr:tyrosine--tRNA ligase [Candidatus Saccharimonadales bacterium]
MDVEGKVDLICRPPAEEVITRDELISLFNSNGSPRHYIGLEISGRLHLGSLLLTGFKLNDFLAAGVKTNVFLADWHTYINNKLNNDWDLISNVSHYYEKAFKFFCPGVNILHGTKLYEDTNDYWKNFILFSKQITLSRALRSLTIMGRTEKDTLDFSQLLYPSMQSVDIKAMDLDIVHAGTDQRKIHMLVREVFPKLDWKVPVSVHHHLLPGLSEPIALNSDSSVRNSDESKIFSKMSKSNPSSSILIHDSEDEISAKIKKAYCPAKVSQNNPVLEIINYVIFHEFDEFIIERPQKYGGNIAYFSFEDVKIAFEQGIIHPMDLKMTTSRYLNKIISPIRDHLQNDYTKIFQ